jgi:hypothetical protein
MRKIPYGLTDFIRIRKQNIIMSIKQDLYRILKILQVFYFS